MGVQASRLHPRPRGLASACAALVVLAGAARTVTAQGAGSATLRGRVQDVSGGVLPGATVTLTNERTKAVRTQQSDARGEYVFVALQPDPYRVRVESSSPREPGGATRAAAGRPS